MYILKSQRDGSYYIGQTSDLTKRLIAHNKGYSKYTKNKGPFEVVFKETLGTRSEAIKRESFLKSQKSRDFLNKLINIPG